MKNISLLQKYYSLFLPKMVMSGPFMGMKYVGQSLGSVILPKLIGTYEDELHRIFDRIKYNDYQRFIDVGAAEGYYAIGFIKYLFPNLRQAIAFETNSNGRKLIRKLAAINNVLVDVRGHCDIESLSNSLNQEKTILIVDIEGGEFELLDPNKIDFTSCDIIVEVHRVNGKDKDKELIEKFKHTHLITEIKIGKKKLPESISLKPLLTKNASYLLNEFRGNESWLFMEVK